MSEDLGPSLVPGVATEVGQARLLAVAKGATPALVLGPREQALVDDMPWPGRRTEWLAGRAALKWLLREAYGFAPESVQVLPAESGAPALWIDGQLASGPCLGLTHTRRWVVAAAGPAPVGIDACDDADGPRVQRIAGRVFSGEEAERIGAHRSPRHQAATWAVKEAVLKLDQGGVFEPGARSVTLTSLTPVQVPGVHVVLLRLPDAAVAVATRPGAMTQRF